MSCVLIAQFADAPPSEPETPVKSTSRAKGKAKAVKPRTVKKSKAVRPPSPVASEGPVEVRQRDAAIRAEGLAE